MSVQAQQTPDKQESIRDMIYPPKEAKIGARVPDCARCGNKVYFMEQVWAGKCCFHKHTCFKCQLCDKSLTGGFVESDGHVTCKSCAIKKNQPSAPLKSSPPIIRQQTAPVPAQRQSVQTPVVAPTAAPVKVHNTAPRRSGVNRVENDETDGRIVKHGSARVLYRQRTSVNEKTYIPDELRDLDSVLDNASNERIGDRTDSRRSSYKPDDPVIPVIEPPPSEFVPPAPIGVSNGSQADDSVSVNGDGDFTNDFVIAPRPPEYFYQAEANKRQEASASLASFGSEAAERAMKKKSAPMRPSITPTPPPSLAASRKPSAVIPNIASPANSVSVSRKSSIGGQIPVEAPRTNVMVNSMNEQNEHDQTITVVLPQGIKKIVVVQGDMTRILEL